MSPSRPKELPDKIDIGVMKDRDFKTTFSSYKQYCGHCGTQVTPEDFSENFCRDCGSDISAVGLYAKAENGTEGWVFRK